MKKEPCADFRLFSCSLPHELTKIAENRSFRRISEAGISAIRGAIFNLNQLLL